MGRGYTPNVASDSKKFRKTAMQSRKVNAMSTLPRGGIRF